ncbi:MAG TPA: LuxR C-terminal-related transcriptional regulator [Micromonospora sp.]|nr:LuxR C-terminal-related transcriptional regulator [Micromonospora sp.]
MRDTLDQHRNRGSLPLLASNLAAAPLPDPVVARPRLLRHLDAGADGPVTLLVAPAGWGKTTLLSSWFRDRRDRTALAWLSAEPGADAARLWSYLHAALSSADDPPTPAATGKTAARPSDATELPAPTDPVDDEFLIHLAAALSRRSQPMTLIVDDLHRIDDPDVIGGLDFLLHHSNGQLRLVAAGRTDDTLPVHRWRLTGNLTELHAGDLAFTAEEVAELLAEHDAHLPVDHVAELHARTEGWPVALRLATRSLNGHPDPARFVAEFGGDHPDVAAYLAEEVLAHLPAEARDALSRAAAIAPWFDAGLIDALTGRTDGTVLLDAAGRCGFVVPLGSRPAAYRCHRLLAELLRGEILRRPPQETHDLRRRAATWYASRRRPELALQQALAAGEWGRAVDIFTGQWRDLVTDCRVDESLPDPSPPVDAVRADPELALACAVERLGSGDSGAVDNYLHRSGLHAASLQGERRRRLELLLTATRLAAARTAGDAAAVANLARNLLDLLPAEPAAGGGAPPDPGTRALARSALGATALAAGELKEAETELVDGLRHAERVNLPRLVLACAARLALVQALQGRLRDAEQLARTATAAPADREVGRADRAHAYLALAVVAGHRDRPGEVEATLALADAEPAGEPTMAALAALVRAELLRDRGDLTASHQALLAGRELAERVAPWLIREFIAVEAELSLLRGNVDLARQLLPRPNGEKSAEPARMAVALARTDLYAEDPHGAARILPDWDGPESESWPLPLRLEAGLLETVAARRIGDPRRATRLLERVLQLAEPEGFRRVFQTEPTVRDLLAAHLDSGTAYWPLVTELVAADDQVVLAGVAPTVSGELLTERELTVLRYLQSILSNVEIAREMSLSVNTIKTHVRNIYRKLDTTRRRDAVRRARELRLL